MYKTLLFAGILFLVSCKKEKKAEPFMYTEEAIDGLVNITSFPLKEGNKWRYTIKYPGTEENEYKTVNYTCGPETKIGDFSFYKLILEEASSYKGGPFTYDMSQYSFANTDKGLYATDLSFDTTSFYDSAACVLQYPAELNAGWSTAKPIHSGRTPLKFVRLTTSAGTFDCVKLQVEYYDAKQPANSNTLQDLYFSSKGLIMLTQTTITAPSSPGAGYQPNTKIMVLTSTNF